MANLLAAPAAEAVGVYGMLASAVGGLVPPLAPVLEAPSAVLLAWVTAVARLGADVGLTVDRRTAWLLLAGTCAAAAVMRARAAKPAR